MDFEFCADSEVATESEKDNLSLNEHNKNVQTLKFLDCVLFKFFQTFLNLLNEHTMQVHTSLALASLTTKAFADTAGLKL